MDPNQNVQTPIATNTLPASSPSHSKKLLFPLIGVIAILILGASLVMILYLGLGKKAQYQIIVRPSPTLTLRQTKNTNFTLPVAPNGTFVQIMYHFTGKIESFAPQQDGVLLRLDIHNQDKNIPDFKVTKDTNLVKGENTNSYKPATISDITSGLQAYITDTYNFETAEWTVRDILIIQNTPAATPSVSLKQ